MIKSARHGWVGAHADVTMTPRPLRLSLLASVVLAATAFAGAPEEKIAQLELTLPTANAPVANYVTAVRTGNLIFLAGHIPRDAAGKVIAGKVGRGATEEDAAAAAKQATLALLATLKREVGDLGKVKRIVRVGGFVNGTDDFQNQPKVMNGCSDLLVAVFGDRGRHARAALGVNSLPLGALVEIEMVVEVE
jgi:enamine deaminase RidA (YjgF/YER057c/UK114 family)